MFNCNLVALVGLSNFLFNQGLTSVAIVSAYIYINFRSSNSVSIYNTIPTYTYIATNFHHYDIECRITTY